MGQAGLCCHCDDETKGGGAMYQRRDRKTGKRTGNWYISVAGDRQSSGTDDKKRAAALEHKLNTEAWERRHGLVTPVWEQACAEWIGNNPVIAGKYEATKFIAFWRDRLVGKRLVDITPKVMHGIMGQHFKKVSLLAAVPANATANSYVAFVGRVIRSASNLNPRFTHYPQSRGRDRWLTVEEWRQLAAVMGPDLRDVCLFALATGLREGNVLAMRRDWVKGDWILIPGEFTKTDKPYGIPLNGTAQAIVRGRLEATVCHPEFLFINGGNPWYRVMLSRAFRKAVAASGIPEITFHGLRHTFASWLAQKGVDHSIRARLGCWSTGSMADHYSHFDVESLRPYAGLIDDILTAAKPSYHVREAS